MSNSLIDELNQQLSNFYTRSNAGFNILSIKDYDSFSEDFNLLHLCNQIKTACEQQGFVTFIETGTLMKCTQLFNRACNAHDIDTLPYFNELIEHPVFNLFDSIYTIYTLENIAEAAELAIYNRVFKRIDALPAEWMLLGYKQLVNRGDDKVPELLIQKLHLTKAQKDLLHMCGEDTYTGIFKSLSVLRMTPDQNATPTCETPEF